MNSIKTLAVVALLAAAGIGLYIKINSTPPSVPPEEAAGTWDAPPPIDMGSIDTQMSGATAVAPPLATGPVGGMAPSYDAAGGAAPPFGGSAPAFSPPAAGGEAPAFNSAPGGAAPPFGSPAASTAPPFDAATSTTAPPFDSSASAPYPETKPATADPFVQPASGASAVPPTAAAIPKATDSGYDQAWEQAQQLLAQNQLDAAHKALSAWYDDDSLTPVMREQLVDLLSQLAGTLIYSNESFLEPAYQVQSGETLTDIATRYQISPQLLAKINGLPDGGPLTEGQQLKVLRGPFNAFVSITQRELTLALDGRYAGRFKIGVGQEWQPTEGEFEVKTKYPNPTYFGRNQTIDAENPDNPLGEHWVGLVSKDGAYSGPLGIHGTHDPTTIEGEEPRGYIRLSPQDVADLFDILTVGSKVMIRR